MTTAHDEGPERLVRLLETLPAEVRREVTAFLLHAMSGTARPGALELLAGQPAAMAGSRLASMLPAGEDSQLVTIRLPTERHVELRDWCGEHGFTMAAVVRGLVERFLESQRGGSSAA